MKFGRCISLAALMSAASIAAHANIAMPESAAASLKLDAATFAESDVTSVSEEDIGYTLLMDDFELPPTISIESSESQVAVEKIAVLFEPLTAQEIAAIIGAGDSEIASLSSEKSNGAEVSMIRPDGPMND